MKKNYLKILLVLFVFVFGTSITYAQRTISGTITEETAQGLPGVSVVVKGTTTGTTTDIDGKYSLSVPDGVTLVFSYVGYISQEVVLGNQSTIDLQLQPDVSQLEELVVVGYGRLEERDITGSVASIISKDFNRGVISSPEELFQGRAPGVQVITSSGEPGAGIDIRIRGTSSVRSGNNPLFVIDGVPLGGGEVQGGGSGAALGGSSARNPLSFLNPNDIERIDILKDASATAIYGSRGANGVVIVTTKKGKGKGLLDYSYSVSIANISKKYDLLDANAYLDAWTSFNPGANRENQDFGANTDWQDEILRTAVTSNHNLSYGGGDEKTNYRFSISYQDQEGIIKNSGLERFTARFNGGGSFLNDRVSVNSQIAISNIKDENVPISRDAGFEGDLIANMLKFNPTIPVLIDTLNPKFDGVHLRDGKGFVQLTTADPNPAAILEYSRSFTNTLRLLASAQAEVKLLEELSFTTSVGLDRSISSRKDAFSRDLRAGDIWQVGRLYTNDNENLNSTWENYFTYKKKFGIVQFTGLLGYSYQRFARSNSRGHAALFEESSLDIMLNNSSSAGVAVLTNSSLERDELQSFYGRFIGEISDKYLITATLRVDGSSRFGPNNRYGIFPAVAFKWRISEEGFLPDVFNQLDLRAGWGIIGNQEIGHNLFTHRVRYGDRDINEGGVIQNASLIDVSFENPDLKWESTEQVNLGLDFGFFEGRLSGTLDFYRKSTQDQLIQEISTQPAPNRFRWENIDDLSIINTGVELGLNVTAIDKSDFSWNISTNFAYNTNMVEGPPSREHNGGRIHGQGLSLAFSQRIAGGQPLFAYLLRDFVGFSEDGKREIYTHGDVQRFSGRSPLPKINAGITNTLTYKNFSLSIFFTGQFGQYIYNNTANAFFTAGSIGNGRNVTRNVIGNGEDRLNAPDVSTRFLEKGDFFRFQNFTFGYNIPIQSKYISKLDIFFSGQNLLLFTSYSGQDPEVNVDKRVENATEVDNIPSFGIDYTTYPRARLFTFGANISF